MNRGISILVLALLLVTSATSRAVVYPSPSRRLRFYPGKDADRVAKLLAQTADEDRNWAEREFGRDYDGVTDVRVAVDPVTFTALQPRTALAPPWASGVAYPSMNLVVIRVGPHEENPRALLRHELSHIAVGRLTQGRAPRWLLEGLAVVDSGDAWSAEGPPLMQAALTDHLYRFDSLTRSFPSSASDAELAYAQSAAFVKFLLDRFGEARIDQVLREMVKGSSFDEASIHVLGAPPGRLESEWRRSLSKWEIVLRYATSREFFWGLLTVLCLVAGWTLRRRRRRRIQAMAREEEALSMRAFLRAPAAWADRDEDEPEAGNEFEENFDLNEEVDAADGDDLPDPVPSARDVTPKKPTLH